MRFKFPILLLLLVLSLNSCVSVQVKENTVTKVSQEIKKPKNIILMIGDGMGLSQVSAAIYYKNGKPNFERFSTIGLSKTSSASDLITDSAAGATVFSTGVKTYNGAIGVNQDTLAVPTIVEQLSTRGLATGIVATSSIQHATPASFYAHVKSRRMYEEITEFARNGRQRLQSNNRPTAAATFGKQRTHLTRRGRNAEDEPGPRRLFTKCNKARFGKTIKERKRLFSNG